MQDYQPVVLATTDGSNTLTVLPGYGGICNQLSLSTHDNRSVSVIAGLPDKATLASDHYFRNIPLYPFANRLADGVYKHQGREYRFDINEPARNNTLHGFLHHLVPEVLYHEESFELATLELLYRYEGTVAGYPFPADIQLTFLLESQNGFTLDFSVTNRHTRAAPLGIGWHPYFTLGEPVDELQLQLPPVQRVEVDERMLPTGKLRPFPDFESLGSLDSLELDTCLALEQKTTGIASTRLWSPRTDTGLEIWQNTSARLHPADDNNRKEADGFRYVQVFIPPDRQSIAIEPVSCGINAFNTGENLVLLEPGQTYSTQCGVSLF